MLLADADADVQLLKVTAQCMANFVTTGVPAAAALWSAAFPEALQHLAGTSDGDILLGDGYRV